MASVHPEKARDYLAESNHYYNIWRGSRLASAFIGNLAIVPAMIDYEMRYDKNRRFDVCIENTDVPMILRTLVMVMSFLAILLLIPYRYYYRVWFRHIPLTYSQLPTLKKLSLTQVLAIRKKPGFFDYFGGDTISSIFLNLINPYPYLDFTFTIPQERAFMQESVCYYISELFYAIMFVRFVILALAVFNFGKFRDSFSWRYCEKYRVPPSATFSLKCYTVEQPVLIVFGLLVLPSIWIFGAIMRIFERPMHLENLDYDYAGNSYWNAIIVMTTVGYGDIFPVSLLGRIANTFCAFCGGIILPMAFVTVGSMLQLKDQEQEAARSIRLSSDAAAGIKAALKYNYSLQKSKGRRGSISNVAENMKNPLYSDMKLKLMQFRKCRTEQAPDTSNVIQIYQNMKANLEKVEKNFRSLTDLVNELVGKNP